MSNQFKERNAKIRHTKASKCGNRINENNINDALSIQKNKTIHKHSKLASKWVNSERDILLHKSEILAVGLSGIPPHGISYSSFIHVSNTITYTLQLEKKGRL